jgi:hypothetical protein
MEAQTFTIEPQVVNFTDQVNITSVDLFFKQKPFGVGNISGALDPGVSVFIVPTAAGGLPNYRSLNDYTVARKEFSEIVSSRDASVSTRFTFITPVPVKTGIEYAVIIKPDLEESFVLWASTKGEINVTDDTVSPGLAGKYKGQYFELSNSSTSWQPLTYKSLKFGVNVARYAYNGTVPEEYVKSFTLNMNNYEFVTYNISRSVGSFIGGEMVFQDKETADGTCAVVQGNDSYIVVKDRDKADVRKVISVSDGDSKITVDRPFSFTNSGSNFIRTTVASAYIGKTSRFVNQSDNFIVLSNSSSNSVVRFTNNSILIGEQSGALIANAFFNDILVHSTEPHIYVYSPAGTNFEAKQIFTYTSSDNLNGTLSSGEMVFPAKMYQPQNLDLNQPVMLKSRTNEVAFRNWSSKEVSTSSRLLYTITSSGDYSSPQIDFNATDVFFTRYIINNDSSNEQTKYGNAYSKHITKKINFANGRQAEDMLVYLQAYKPAYTDIEVYAKLFNSEDSDYFDDKDWTLLQEISGNRASSLTNLSDFVEYTYGLYPYPETDYTLTGVCNITGGSINLVGIGTNFLDENFGLTAGDLIKIYPALFPENYVVVSVYDVGSGTTATLGTAITAAEAVALGSGGLKIDKLVYKNQAFSNKRNDNIVRYFNSTMTLYDKYDTFSIKIVFLSENQFIIPKVANIRAVGVSA